MISNRERKNFFFRVTITLLCAKYNSTKNFDDNNN